MREIPLTQNKVALIDDEDFELVNRYKWYVAKTKNNCYAAASFKSEKGIWNKILMHRIIMGNPDCLIDHMDMNGLNNQKQNLRRCSYTQNNAHRKSAINSTSKFLGVYLSIVKIKNKEYKHWCAKIENNHKRIFLGSYKTEEEAAQAYNKAAIELHGEFSNLNQI